MKTEDRLRELEGDVWALMDYLGVKSMTYKSHRTGSPDNPFAYEKRIVKIEDMNRKSGN